MIYIWRGGEPDFPGDGGPATSATININAIAVDGFGDLFIAKPGIPGICEITPDGIMIPTYAGGAHIVNNHRTRRLARI